MAETPVLGLPLMEPGQGGSNVIYNSAMTILDTATGGGGGSGVPGGATGQAQYKSGATTFGGSSGLVLSATQVTAIALATPLPLAQGGTGAASQAGAQAALGLVPGTNVQPSDAELTALAGLLSAADRLPYFTGPGTAALSVFTSAARAFLDDPDTASQRLTLGLKALAILDTVATPQIDQSAVTYVKIQHVSGPPRVLGRYSPGAGPVQELTLGSGLTVDGSGVITAAGGGGGGDVSSSTALSVDSELAVFDGTSGKLLKRGTGTGLALLTNGVLGLKAAPTGAVVGTTDTQTLTDKTISGVSNTLTVRDLDLAFTDITTANVSTTAHGLTPKAPGSTTQFLRGDATWATPAGGGGDTYWSRAVLPGAADLTTGLLAFWRLEEASGNRVSSVGSFDLVPQGTVAQITNAAGKTGQAVSFNGTSGTYLSIADNATLSAGTSSFTLACWVYYTSLPGASPGIGIAGKGNGSSSYAQMEYMLWHSGGLLRWLVGNGSTFTDLQYPSLTPAPGTWYFLVGWYDATADIQSLQINNGTIVQVANANGSHDSISAFEVGRVPGWAGSATMQGRVDTPMFFKRVLTLEERTAWYNAGAGQDYPPVSPTVGVVTPTVAGDLLALTAQPDTPAGLTDGTLRWSGTDFEGRKAGAWTSLTQALALPLAIAEGGTSATTAPNARTALGLGTMATQDASAVAITGGSAQLGGKATPYWLAAPNAQIDTFYGPVSMESTLQVNESLGVGIAPSGNKLFLRYDRSVLQAIVIQPSADTGPGAAVYFQNAALGNVGTITTTATATAYNTSSDIRLKHAITALSGALGVMRRLRPVTHLWNADDSRGYGFLAHELQQVIPDAVTGEPDAVHDDGSVRPQQVDHAKLVPWLTAMCQELDAQVQALTARVVSLEEQLGI